MNLILTPVYNAFNRVLQMCQAIDRNTVLPYLHILIDDNSNNEIPINSSKERRILSIKSDIPTLIHKNQLGQAIQLGYDYAHQKFWNEKPNPKFDYVFLIESDVVVFPEWDKKQIDLIPTLPMDWATLDVQSVDEDGKPTYPVNISPRYGFISKTLEQMHYADFQCTLFNPVIFETGIKFSDFPSHFDILWSRAIEKATGRQHYRTTEISVIHYPSSSRNTLPEEQPSLLSGNQSLL